MKLSNNNSQICLALFLTLTIALRNGVAAADDKCPNSGSTGYVWCEELGDCIAPWETACPVVGEPFQGPTTIDCTDDMRCSVSQGCSFDMGSYSISGLYLSGTNGTLEMTANCTANCTGCTEVDPMVEDDERPSGNTTLDGGDAGPSGNSPSAELTTAPKAGASQLFSGWFTVCFSVWILQQTFSG
jgi:hypothetical protein